MHTGGFEKIEKKMVISAVDVESGDYTDFKEDVGLENLGTVIRASASIWAAKPVPLDSLGSDIQKNPSFRLT